MDSIARSVQAVVEMSTQEALDQALADFEVLRQEHFRLKEQFDKLLSHALQEFVDLNDKRGGELIYIIQDAITREGP